MLMEFLLFLSFYFGGNPQEELIASFCWQQQIYRWFSLRIWEDVCCSYHTVTCLVKIHKNVTEQLTSNNVSAQIFLALWTLANKQIAPSYSTVRIPAICACIRKHNVLQFIYLLFKAFFDFSHHTVTSNTHPFLFSSETWCSAKQSLAVGACNNKNIYIYNNNNNNNNVMLHNK